MLFVHIKQLQSELTLYSLCFSLLYNPEISIGFACVGLKSNIAFETASNYYFSSITFCHSLTGTPGSIAVGGPALVATLNSTAPSSILSPVTASSTKSYVITIPSFSFSNVTESSVYFPFLLLFFFSISSQ